MPAVSPQIISTLPNGSTNIAADSLMSMDGLAIRLLSGTFACCLAACAYGGATIQGTVQLPKQPPQPPVSFRYQNVRPEQIGPPDPAVAVVYLEGQFSSNPNPAPVARMAQEHFQFAPGLLPIQKGSIVEFPNYDDAYHNIFSYSKIKRFDLGRYRKDEKPPALVFDTAGVVKVYCEIHAHMRGTILVLDTPYFAKTDPAGHYALTNLPAGNYVLKAWLSESAVRQTPVQLSQGATLSVDFPAP